jgi:hypothetical protein
MCSYKLEILKEIRLIKKNISLLILLDIYFGDVCQFCKLLTTQIMVKSKLHK